MTKDNREAAAFIVHRAYVSVQVYISQGAVSHGPRRSRLGLKLVGNQPVLKQLILT